MQFKRFILGFFPFLIFLSGCQPQHVWIKQADLQTIDERYQSIEKVLANQQSTSEQQSQALDALTKKLSSQQHAISRLEKRIKSLKAKNGQSDGDSDPEPSENSGRQKTITLPDLDSSLVINPQTYRYIDGKLVIGSVERVHLLPSDWLFEARVDSGAETSSLDARDITLFERDGKRWVKFLLADRQRQQTIPVERPVKRIVRILQASSDEPERRPVVEFKLTVGDIEQVVEFTLSDRSHLEFAILIGRNVLKDMMLVDVSDQFIAPPKYQSKPDAPSDNQEQN